MVGVKTIFELSFFFSFWVSWKLHISDLPVLALCLAGPGIFWPWWGGKGIFIYLFLILQLWIFFIVIVQHKGDITVDIIKVRRSIWAGSCDWDVIVNIPFYPKWSQDDVQVGFLESENAARRFFGFFGVRMAAPVVVSWYEPKSFLSALQYYNFSFILASGG